MTHVVIVTDQTDPGNTWRVFLEQLGASTEIVHPSRSSEAMLEGRSLLVDAASSAFDEDELLAQAALARALSVPLGIILPPTTYEDIEPLLDDICSMRIARRESEVPRLLGALVRAAADHERIEYLTVSPRGDALLAVAGDGAALLLSRPAHPDDDESEVEAIAIADDARSAEIVLASGARFTILARGIVRHEGIPSSSGQAAATQAGALSAIDGAKLGARIRELRLAAGLTQAELARRTGIHRPNIARVEAGRHTPSLETLARLAAAIGVPTASVLDGDPTN